MSRLFRHQVRFSLLASLVFGLALAFTFTSLSPATASAASNTPVTHQVAGKVTAKGTSSFTLLMSNNLSATFAVNSNTKYMQGGKPASFAAMEVGMQIGAEVTYDSKVSPYYVATYVSLPTPPPPPTCYTSGQLSGKVTALTSSSFTVAWTNGGTSTPFAVNADTKFYLDGKASTFASLKVGMSIQFTVKSCGDAKYTAVTVNMTTPTPPPCYTSGQLTGKITALTSNGFSTDGSSMVFLVNADTKFYLDGKAASFANLKVGMSIQFTVKSCGDGKYTAVTVSMTTPPPPPACYTSGALNGKVAAKTADAFSVIWANGEVGKTAFTVNADTKIYLNGKPATFADLKAGQYIQFTVKSCGDAKYVAVTVYLTSTTK